MAILRLIGVDTTTGQELSLTTNDIFATGAINVGSPDTPTTTLGTVYIEGDTTTSAYGLRYRSDADGFNGALIYNESTGTSCESRLLLAGGSPGNAAELFFSAYGENHASTPNLVSIISSGDATAFRIGTGDADNFIFVTNGVTRWRMGGADGHFIAVTDNTYDIGASGATRPRTAYFGTSLNVGDGITPSTTNGNIIAGDGTNALTWNASQPNLRVDRRTTTGNIISGVGDVNGTITQLVWNNADGTDAIAELRLFVGDTATNNGYLRARSTTNSTFPGKTELTDAGGSSTGIVINASGGSGTPIEFAQAETVRWRFQAGTGHFLPAVTNTYDIGATSLRVRTGYFGTSLNVGTGITDSTDSGDIIAGDGIREYRWDASANTISIGAETTSAVIQGIDATTVSTAGTNLLVRAGNGNTNGEGGVLNLLAGTSPSGTPGVVQINSLPLPTTLSTTVSIDVTTTGTTGLYTIPTGRSAVVTAVIIRPTVATAVNGDGEFSVGTNASTFDDIIATTALTGLDATTESYIASPGGVTHIAAAAEVVTFQVDTAETGTALTVTVDVIGYLL